MFGQFCSAFHFLHCWKNEAKHSRIHQVSMAILKIHLYQKYTHCVHLNHIVWNPLLIHTRKLSKSWNDGNYWAYLWKMKLKRINGLDFLVFFAHNLYSWIVNFICLHCTQFYKTQRLFNDNLIWTLMNSCILIDNLLSSFLWHLSLGSTFIWSFSKIKISSIVWSTFWISTYLLSSPSMQAILIMVKSFLSDHERNLDFVCSDLFVWASLYWLINFWKESKTFINILSFLLDNLGNLIYNFTHRDFH